MLRREFIKLAAISGVGYSIPIFARIPGPLYFDTGETPDDEMEIPTLICPRPSIAVIITDGIKVSIKSPKIIGDIELHKGAKLVKAEIDHFAECLNEVVSK